MEHPNHDEIGGEDACRLDTARLALRPLGLGDLDALHRLWTDPRVRRFLWDDRIVARDEVAALLDENTRLFRDEGAGLWGVRERSRDDLVGFCGFWYFHTPPQLQLLYAVAPERWGTGVATEAAEAVLRYGFERLRMDRVVASADAPNAASLRVMAKLGMEAIERATLEGLDTVTCAITRAAWRRRLGMCSAEA